MRVEWKLMAESGWLVVRYTRHWLHYGTVCFACLCSLIAAIEGLAAK